MMNIIEVHGKKVLLLEDEINKKKLPSSDIADVWIVNHDNAKKVKRFLLKIIRSKDINTFLKPIFLQRELKNFYSNQEVDLREFCDGYIKDLNLLEKLPLIDQIISFPQVMKASKLKLDSNSEDYYLKKVLLYYYTRKKKIKPVLSRFSITGYSFPILESMFFNDRQAYLHSRAILQEAFHKGFLARTYVDTSHLCKKCNSGFLNYREVCPKCYEHNLKAIDIIHHFRCAYVGNKKDFILKDKLVCPKCSSELKNLGVDYDNPGKMFHCKNKKCNHEFQDAPIGVSCIDCKTEQFPETLVVKKTYQYELTNLTIQTVLGL